MLLGYGYDDDPEVQIDVLAVLRRLAPFEVKERKKLRVGRDHDGGYVMVDDFEGIDACYSIGISDDVSWDKEMAGRGFEIFQYDHTISALPEENSRFNWRKIGLTSSRTASSDLRTLPDMIRDNGHEASRDLILKIDIEGGEWDVLSSLDPVHLTQFRQIVGEFHHFERLTEGQTAKKIMTAISNITLYHKLVHVHANNWASWTITGAVPIPSHLELTLFRASGRRLIPSRELFPTTLDMPNDPRRPDYILGSFRY